MTVLDSAVHASATSADVDARRVPPPPEPGGRRRVRAALTRPREVSIVVRYVSIVGAAMVAFAPAILANAAALADGSPTAYLLFVPVWGLMIALGLDATPRGREIGDGEFDRILVVVVGGGLGLTAALVVPRIPAVAAFWHADLLPLLIWVFAASIVIFGIRRVVRDYLVWLFLLACFPPNFLLLGQAFGGSTTVFGSLTVVLALVVTYLSLRRRRRVAATTVVAAGLLGFGLVWLLAGTPALAFTVPAAVVTVMALIVRVRSGGTGGAPKALPKQSIATLASVWIVALVILVLTPHTPYSPKPVASPPIGEDWLGEMRTLGIGITEPRVFDWGPRVMGSGGDVRRYRITTGLTGPENRPLSTAYLDVYSSADLGRFSSYRRGLWYETVPPATISATPATSGGRHTQIGSIANTLESVRTSDEALWTGRFWGWRVPTSSGDRYFAFYLMAARNQPGSPEVAEPRPPSYATTVIEPAGWLIRGGADVDDQVAGDTALDTALTDLAWSMVDAVERPSR